MEETIKDFSGRIIGKIETKPNGDKIIRDFGGRFLGRYDKQLNKTMDFYGRIVAQGEALTMLLR